MSGLKVLRHFLLVNALISSPVLGQCNTQQTQTNFSIHLESKLKNRKILKLTMQYTETAEVVISPCMSHSFHINSSHLIHSLYIDLNSTFQHIQCSFMNSDFLIFAFSHSLFPPIDIVVNPHVYHDPCCS